MQVPSAAGEWAQESFGRGELGAERRTRRRVTLAAQLASHAGESPAGAWRGDTAANEGAYRLLGNAQVTPSAFAAGGFQAAALAAQTPGNWWADAGIAGTVAWAARVGSARDAAGARRTRG